MKVTNEKTENSQAFLTIEMEPAEVEEYMEEAYRRLVNKVRIPGFRKGKAPRALLERSIGRDSLFDEALEILLPKAYAQAVEEQEIEAFARPQLEITQTEPLVFKATVPLKPTIKLGDYKSISVKQEPVEVTEESINAVIEQLRHQYATWEPVERPVDFGDLVVFDVESSIDGEPFINQQGAQYQVARESTFPAPGFAEQLVGMEKDGEKEFKLKLPDDYSDSEKAGKEVSFKIKLTEIKQEVLPEVTDDFAREVNPEFETVDLLRERTMSEMQSRAEERSRLDFEERVVDAVVELSEVDFPPVLVEAETNQMLNQYFQGGSQQLEQYLASVNKTQEELQEEMRPAATKRVSRSLVLGRVVEEEKIEVADAEIDAEIDSMTERANENKEELKKMFDTPQARESIGQTLITRKAVERLIEIAGGLPEEG